MEKVEVLPPIHEHPLLPFTRFFYDRYCRGCGVFGYIYGGFCCNELGCESVFHKQCANATERPAHILEKSNVHDHPIQLSDNILDGNMQYCKTCNWTVMVDDFYYKCFQCELQFHVACTKLFPEANNTSHPQHQLKLLACEVAPDYTDKKCLLCGNKFKGRLHHCDVCNFSICGDCMSNPPPLGVVSPTTHEHQLHLVPRRIDFTCNACGTLGDRSPYFCLQCNFMIHWHCIDLPRIININRHDHRISYTRRLGHGNWTCGVCRKKVDGFYGAYSCSKCSNYVVHSRCATSQDVWDMIELEGTPEEPEEDAPFEVIDDNTIKHFSHDHNLRINKDGRILHESTLCEACVFQICSEPFYSCERCDFLLHQKCANLPRKKRHICDNLPLTLDTNDTWQENTCRLCKECFTGFKYMSLTRKYSIDVRCGSISEPFMHGSHPHPLYLSKDRSKSCNECGERVDIACFSCDECDYSLDFKCALIPQKVMRHRYDDHPLYLSYGESCGDGEYWCEACETKVNSKKWFYTCNDCGVVLHISCVVGDLSHVMPGSGMRWADELVPNTSVCRPLCSVCNSRCKLPSVLKVSKPDVVLYFCSLKCFCLKDDSSSDYSSDW